LFTFTTEAQRAKVHQPHRGNYQEFHMQVDVIRHSRENGNPVIIRKSTRFRVKPGMTARGYFTYDLLSNGQRARALLENRRLPILQKITNLCIPCLKRAPPFRDGRMVKCKLFHALCSKSKEPNALSEGVCCVSLEFPLIFYRKDV
jgi:hypothetical protein